MKKLNPILSLDPLKRKELKIQVLGRKQGSLFWRAIKNS
jgi:hypothetical protein